MNKIIQFITARRVSLGLILLLAGLMYVSTIIPQSIDSTPEKVESWRRSFGGILWLIDVFNLHSIYSQPWFAILILLSSFALWLSSYDQFTVVRKKLYSVGTTSADTLIEKISEPLLRSVADRYGYQIIQNRSGGVLKFVKFPWGFWGVFLLHIGMALVVTASLSVSLTTRQGVLIMGEGEQRNSRGSWNASEHGLFASMLKLPGTIRLDKVNVNFDSTNQPKEVSSNVNIINSSGRSATLTAYINRTLRYNGLRVYHSSEYGNVFEVVFTDKNGAIYTEKIAAQQPVSLTKPGYSDELSIAWSPYLLSAKYYADTDRKSMLSTNPELILRLTQGDREIARTVLTKGTSAMLGEYKVQLKGVARWSKLIFVDTAGMPLVFTGFAIIMLGGLLQYLTPPRELIAVSQGDNSYTVYWKAAAFREFFLEERDRLAIDLQQETIR